MTKRSWLNSASFPPMNGQPVWIFEKLTEQIHQAVYEWIEFGDYAFRWRMRIGGHFLIGHGLWQPRLDGEMPDPPPAEKPKPLDKPAAPL